MGCVKCLGKVGKKLQTFFFFTLFKNQCTSFETSLHPFCPILDCVALCFFMKQIYIESLHD